MADSLLFKESMSFLRGQGWVIARPDKQRNGFATEHRTLKTIWRMRLLVDAKNSVATFRTQWSSEVMGIEIEDDPVVFKGRDKSVYKTAFRRMDEIVQKFAKDLPDADVRYVRQ
jgi:hypothetical protein